MAERLAIEPVNLSSSALRRRIGEGRDVRSMMPDAVVDAITREGLYLQTPC
jgi:nicotinic acid mononucleotide adenylyltransferase